MSAQAHLKQSNAGMRLIALLTLYNQGDFDRLRAYITDNYAPAALTEQSAEERTREFQDGYAARGKLRVEQVAAIGKHQAVVVVQAQQDGQYHALQVAVEEDFPHRITLVAWGMVDIDNEPPILQERQEERD
jgi:hypothetical protein